METAPPYPLFLRLDGRRVLLVGGGPVATEKARALKSAGAVLHVVAPEVSLELAPLADRVTRREFCEADLAGAWLVVAAAPPAVNRRVRREAESRRVYVVAVDDVENCSAIGAAQLTRGGLTVAISSSGRAPALVALLRRALDRLVPDDVAQWVELAEAKRAAWKERGVPIADRAPLLLRALQELYSPAEARS